MSINYNSGNITVYCFHHDERQKNVKSGLKWRAEIVNQGRMNDQTRENRATAKWTFSWDTEKVNAISRFDGYIEYSWITDRSGSFGRKIPVKIETTGQKFVESMNLIPNRRRYEGATFSYKLHLTPVFADEKDISEKFEVPSETSDAVLVVEDRKMHVNKALLSFYSDFFKTLFNSNFAEKMMTEIPINDVKYVDLGRLLSLIHPDPGFPNVETSIKLLELADRFMMPIATRHVAHFLSSGHWKEMEKSEVIYLADAYNMKNLLDKGLAALETRKAVEDVTKSTEYSKMSNETKVKLFHRMLELKEEVVIQGPSIDPPPAKIIRLEAQLG